MHEIGKITADSGLSSNSATVVACEVDNYRLSHEEGILRAEEMTWDDLRRSIARGRIDDGFTLGAFALYDAHRFIH